MRIRVIQKPPPVTVDGIALHRFEVGGHYDVGTQLGCLFLAENWAIPVPDHEPTAIVPFSETDPLAPKPFREWDAPPNLFREHYPPYLNDRPDLAQDFERRRRPRAKSDPLR